MSLLRQCAHFVILGMWLRLQHFYAIPYLQ